MCLEICNVISICIVWIYIVIVEKELLLRLFNYLKNIFEIKSKIFLENN